MNNNGRVRQLDRDEEPPTNALERRRWQNRVSQRNYRRKVKDKIAQLEDRLLLDNSQSTKRSAAPTYPSIDISDMNLDLRPTSQFDVELDQHQLCPTCKGLGNVPVQAQQPAAHDMMSPQTLSTTDSAPSLHLSDNASTPDPDAFDNFDSFFPGPSSALYNTIPTNSVSKPIEASPLTLPAASMQQIVPATDSIIQSLPADADAQSARPAIYLINPTNNTDSGSVYLIRLP